MRYARHRSGRKYSARGTQLPLDRDADKRRSAEIFHGAWMKVRSDRTYQAMKRAYVRASADAGASPR